MTSIFPDPREQGVEASIKEALAIHNATGDERKRLEAEREARWHADQDRQARVMCQHLTDAQMARLIKEREAAYNARYSFYADLTNAIRRERVRRQIVDTLRELRAAALCPSTQAKVRGAVIRADELIEKLEEQ